MLLAALAFSSGPLRGTPAPKQDAGKDEAALLQLEQEWLHARDLATLERIYGKEFVHVHSDGRILTWDEDLADYRRLKAPPAAILHGRFELPKVRL